MSELSDTHNVQLTNLEIFVLEYILEDLDVNLELIFKNTKKEIIKIYRNRALPKELWFEKVDNCIKEYQDRVVKKIEMKNNYTDVVLSI